MPLKPCASAWPMAEHLACVLRHQLLEERRDLLRHLEVGRRRTRGPSDRPCRFRRSSGRPGSPRTCRRSTCRPCRCPSCDTPSWRRPSPGIPRPRIMASICARCGWRHVLHLFLHLRHRVAHLAAQAIDVGLGHLVVGLLVEVDDAHHLRGAVEDEDLFAARRRCRFRRACASFRSGSGWSGSCRWWLSSRRSGRRRRPGGASARDTARRQAEQS